MLVPLICLMAAACADPADEVAHDAALIATDPIIARALHDPLMSDPDLASRNEANAAIGFVDSGALPVITASPEAASKAREALRLDLLERGSIPELPPPARGAGGKEMGPLTSAADLLAAVGAPAVCESQLIEDFALAADLPPVAAIPPSAMVMQAGGADGDKCGLRIIRYHSVAPHEDVLQYHYTEALRGGLRVLRYAEPEDIIAATGAGGEALLVHIRPAANGLTGVLLIYRAPLESGQGIRGAGRP